MEQLRERQIRNFAALLLLSRGVPMMLAGDEVRNTQKGNNNPYCQDNEIGWLNWALTQQHSGLLRFWSRMIDFRKRHAALRCRHFFTGAVNDRGLVDVTWHGTELGSPGWGDPGARVLALTLAGFNGDADIHVMLNMYWESLDFALPFVPGRSWHKAVDTAAPSPHDIADPGNEPEVGASLLTLQPRSVVVLVSR